MFRADRLQCDRVFGPGALMLGVICQRLREDLHFDRETERFVGNERANALLDGPPPRPGWEQFYKMA